MRWRLAVQPGAQNNSADDAGSASGDRGRNNIHKSTPEKGHLSEQATLTGFC
jgi:hypothetical protein